ncbi:DUF4124 domain-containing protein [Undibacterium sp. CY7W]|uniref:DUF4124 domain-containing protein n=1 Tax=Undibacterium rugosum TaxID=2762291 RepID=A0A923I0C2_9BURK|nr:DUF4124 domain-containing protein [Undibacterium rugosum]MBC3935474.1 DUF4124 domain-containing protein [Undibacterium rugosum]
MLRRPLHIIAALFALGITGHALAQYVWVDDKGNKQYSDTAPPASVPKNRILKTPGKSVESNEPAAPAKEAGTAAASANKPATTASRNEDFNKRRAEQAEKDKKAAEDQQAASDKSKNCERAKTYQKTLESGVRVATTDKNGERNYMDDAQRAKEIADTKKATAGCQ